jgi:aspartate kinase
VVSAVSKITDKLLKLAAALPTGDYQHLLCEIVDIHRKIAAELQLDSQLLEATFQQMDDFCQQHGGRTINPAACDQLCAFGEKLSAQIMAAQLMKSGSAAQYCIAGEIGMITNDHFGSAEVLDSSYGLLGERLSQMASIPVITGFIGQTSEGATTTLGRGGSDYSAAIIGSAVMAKEIQIWTDVDGIMSTDPKDFNKAVTIPELSFEEASELAYFGVKVIHPKTILPAMRHQIPVRILNSFNPSNVGTRIVAAFGSSSPLNNQIVGLTCKSQSIAIVIRSADFFDGNIHMERIFKTFAKYDLAIDVILTSVASTSLVCSESPKLSLIIDELRSIGDLELQTGKSVICVVGGHANTASFIGKIFTALGCHDIVVEMLSQASQGISLTFVVDDLDAKQTLQIIHNECVITEDLKV